MKNKLRFISLLILFFGTLWVVFSQEEDPPVTHLVVIRNMKFQPQELRVSAGDSVKFVNKDLVIHNVTEENKVWASPTLAPDASWTMRVEQDLSYFCSFHPMMRGKLLVNKK